MSKSTIILVAGRHRSGLSITAGVLHHLGVPMGDRLRWNHWANPRGDFEDLEFQLLVKRMQPDWRQPRNLIIEPHREAFGDLLRVRCKTHGLWGVKTRLCHLLDLFLAEPVGEVKVIATQRPIEESAASLCNWFSTLQMPEARAICRDCDDARQEALDKYHPHVFWAPYEKWTSQNQIEALADFVGVPFREEAVKFVDPRLNHFGTGSTHGLVQFRKMEPEDASRGLGKVVEQLVSSRAPPLSEELAAARVKQIILDGGEPWVATEDGRVVAMATLHVRRKLVHGGSAVAYVDDVVTHEDCRGRAIGRTLVQTLVEIARRRGCYKMLVNCQASAAGFYERCGFEVDGVTLTRRLRGGGEGLSDGGP